MESFVYQKKFDIFQPEKGSGTKKHRVTSSLAEKMTVKDDEIILDFKTEFEGRDLSEAGHKLREIEPVFSTNDDRHRKDVQIVLDEN